MPLPKIPTKPATQLDSKDYPKAPTGKVSKASKTPKNPANDAAASPAPVKTTASVRPAPAPAAPKTPPRTVVTPLKSKTAKVLLSESPVAPSKKLAHTRLKSSARQSAAKSGMTKLFVLDTNVLMHDPTSLFRFEEHDIFLPMSTLEELDNHKRGMSDVARNARQVSRILDSLAENIDEDAIENGIALSKLGNKEAKGKLFFQTRLEAAALPVGLPPSKTDNQILGIVQALSQEQPGRLVVLVSKDINMRIKARALALPAEDYFNDQVLEDTDLLYSGVLAMPDDFWETHGKGMESWQENRGNVSHTYYRITGPLVPAMLVNQFIYLEPPSGDTPFYAQVKQISGKTAVLKTLRDYTHTKNGVWGITARNREQNFALNLLMDPECDFVTLLGQAGTGKTLLALAAGLAQVLEAKTYNEIIFTRVTVPVGEDIGFLPGTEEEKMNPWMGALDDNLEVLHKPTSEGGEWGRAATQDLIRSRIKVKSLNFMRGRTFVDKFVIIDEAQNLTPKQMKTLITRAGPGTKILCLGNIAQIDTPYLTEGSSGLTFVVDRFKGWEHSGHVTLARGERSRLADYATEVL